MAAEQTNITVGERASEDYRSVSKYLKIPKASYMRQVLEVFHQSPEFYELLRRAQEAETIEAEAEEVPED